MNRTALFPHHRVAVETIFPTEQAAEKQAREIARSLVN